MNPAEHGADEAGEGEAARPAPPKAAAGTPAEATLREKKLTRYGLVYILDIEAAVSVKLGEVRAADRQLGQAIEVCGTIEAHFDEITAGKVRRENLVNGINETQKNITDGDNLVRARMGNTAACQGTNCKQ